MKIKEIKNPDLIEVGKIVLNKGKQKRNLNIEYSTSLTKTQKKDNSSRIYFISVNNIIKKIGGSNAVGGIKNTFSFYMSGNCGRPSLRTFGINFLIEQELKKGKSIVIHMILIPRVNITMFGMFEETKKEVSIAHNLIESSLVEEYNNRCGKFPDWNFQEGGVKWPQDVYTAFIEYNNKKESH